MEVEWFLRENASASPNLRRAQEKKSLPVEASLEDRIALKAKAALQECIKLAPKDADTLMGKVEANKKKWFSEADKGGKPWVTQKIALSGKKIKLKIYPKDRKNVRKTGRIDIDFDELGKGTGGVVFKTLHYETGRIGVTKVSKSGKTGLGAVTTRIEREKSVLEDDQITHVAKGRSIAVRKGGKKYAIKARLSAKLYNKGELEYIAGLPLKEQFQLCYDVLKGLRSIHKSGKVHRDVKRENILVHKRKPKPLAPPAVKQYRLADFDLVTAQKVTYYGGSRSTMAPEVVEAMLNDLHEVFPPNIDIFSLGMMMLGVWPPWYDSQGNVIESKFSIHPMKEPPKTEFDKVLWKMAHPDPTQRYQTADEAIEALKKAAESHRIKLSEE